MSLAEQPHFQEIAKAYSILETKIFPFMRQSRIGCWVGSEDFAFRPNCATRTSVRGTIIIRPGSLSCFNLSDQEETAVVAALMNAAPLLPGISTGTDGYSIRSVITQATGLMVFNEVLQTRELATEEKTYQIESNIQTSVPITVLEGKPFPFGRLIVEDRRQAVKGERLERLRKTLGPEQTVTMGEDLIGIPIKSFWQIRADTVVNLNQVASIGARQRELLDQVLGLEPTTRIKGYSLGQTSWMEIPSDICLVIDNAIHGNGKPKQTLHLASRFLDAGFKGPIRTEIQTARVPDYLWLRAYEYKRIA